jgi:tetratricopeptide (TPR) repeat protein
MKFVTMPPIVYECTMYFKCLNNLRISLTFALKAKLVGLPSTKPKLSINMDKLFLILSILLLSHTVYSQDQKALIAAGDKFYGKKDYKNALASFLAAQEINPDDAALNFKIGLTYLYSETKSKAASYIDKAFRLNPAVNPDIDYHLGIAFQNTNEFKKAIEHFESFKKKKKQLSAIADEKIAECHIADSLSQNE